MLVEITILAIAAAATGAIVLRSRRRNRHWSSGYVSLRGPKRRAEQYQSYSQQSTTNQNTSNQGNSDSPAWQAPPW